MKQGTIALGLIHVRDGRYCNICGVTAATFPNLLFHRFEIQVTRSQTVTYHYCDDCLNAIQTGIARYVANGHRDVQVAAVHVH